MKVFMCDITWAQLLVYWALRDIYCMGLFPTKVALLVARLLRHFLRTAICACKVVSLSLQQKGVLTFTRVVTKFVVFLEKCKFVKITKLALFSQKRMLPWKIDQHIAFKLQPVYYPWSVWLNILWKPLSGTDILFSKMIFWLVSSQSNLEHVILTSS